MSAALPHREICELWSAALTHHEEQQLHRFKDPGIPADGQESNGQWQELLGKLLDCTGAAGAVVLLCSTGTLYCRATCGTCVPAVGTRLEQKTSITALCFYTGQNFICEDTDRDTRVNAEACRVLGIKSILAVALKRAEVVIGVLELFSSEPQTFRKGHIVLISTFADQLLRLAAQDIAVEDRQHQNSFEVDQEVKSIEFSNTEKQEKRQELGEASDFLLAKFGQPPATSRLPGLVAAMVTFAAVVIFTLQLSRPWQSPMEHSKSSLGAHSVPSRTFADDSSSPHTHFLPGTRLSSVLSANTRDIADKIKGHVSSSTYTSWDTLQHSADSHDLRAEYELALRYANGEGVGQDYSRAMSWFERAAEQGSASAQWKIGLGYLKGIGVEQNNTKAVEWFKRAANQGHIGAQLALSDMYLTGRGVAVDHVRAYTWAAISRRTSNQGEQQLQKTEALLTPSELQQAQTRIALWWGRHANTSLR